MEAETKMADAIEIFRSVINATSDFNEHFPSSSNVSISHQKRDGAVDGENTTANTNDGSWDLADALKRSLYPKVGLVVPLLYLSQLTSPRKRATNHQYRRELLSFIS